MVASLFASTQFFMGSSYVFVNAEAEALVARMAPQPNNTRKELIDEYFTAIKSGALSGTNLLTKLDVDYFLAAHDQQAANLNWVQNLYNLTPVNSPVWTLDRGYTGGSPAYLTTDGYTPNYSVGVKAVQNSVHNGVWSRTDVSAGVDMGNQVMTVESRTSGTVRMRCMTTTSGVTGTVANSLGHTMGNRNNATDHQNFRNGVQLTSSVIASAAGPDNPVILLARNANITGGQLITPASYSSRQISTVHAGSGLTQNEITDLYNAKLAFLTAIGA